MPSRAELEVRANAVSVTASNYPNDSKLEQKVLYAEKTSGASAAVAATGTLTSDATNVTDADTVTIGSTVYRFKDTMAAAYDVKIGASAAVSLDNLKAAINASGTPGTEYFAGTLIHPTVTAGTNTDTTQAVTANTAGTAGNSIASTEASTHLSWGAATLTGGSAAVAATVTSGYQLSGDKNV